MSKINSSPSLPTEGRTAELLAPYLQGAAPPDGLTRSLTTYLDLLLRWNSRTSLTSIRNPEEIVRRHFGEGLFAGVHLARRVAADAALLDFGSGAGFPGIPIHLLNPQLRVTLAESQGKKAAFLHELIRSLSLPTQVWPQRVDAMPPARRFEVVTLRAVDRMAQAMEAAKLRVTAGGWLVTLTGGSPPSGEYYPIPNSDNRWLVLERL